MPTHLALARRGPLLGSEDPACVCCTDSLGEFLLVSLGFFWILYSIVVAVIAVLAVYALVLLVIFLRLRIRELKAAQQPGADDSR